MGPDAGTVPVFPEKIPPGKALRRSCHGVCQCGQLEIVGTEVDVIHVRLAGVVICPCNRVRLGVNLFGYARRSVQTIVQWIITANML